MKQIDLSKTVYELVNQYPELTEIMAGLGFTEIRKRPLLLSVGKLMTIPKGAKMKHIDMADVVAALVRNGFTIAGEMPASALSGEPAKGNGEPGKKERSRSEQLKDYLRRLGSGEDLEAVRRDFVENFTDVEAAEIMRAEQELLREGTPLSEVQRLCDVHSALFHGRTREERIARAEREVEASLAREQERLRSEGLGDVEADDAGGQSAAELGRIEGHPLQTFFRENEALAALLEEARAVREDADALAALLPKVREVAVHYAKKGDLLYPHLKVNYGISGPSQVMWTVDDEIRDALSALVTDPQRGAAWRSDAAAVLERIEEMVYKENNILFPLCAANFTEGDWKRIYRDSKDYAPCLGVQPESWDGDGAQAGAPFRHDGEVVMPGGHLSVEQLTAMLNTLPMEITFVDAGDINRYFNEGSKVFKRPQMAIDRDVFSCHPPKVEPMVRSIIGDFRAGRRSQVPVWMEKNGRTMYVCYMAVRDRTGAYLGTVEVVQDMEFAREHFTNG
ncbi:MAG: DUF438 domain-containing protein [Alloprevotella sp.]|nr:DUF438 domain-containing protein [Prevotella sp.]MBR1712780.1 DUF438 domain-containing protein [Alloprevotella sp.]